LSKFHLSDVFLSKFHLSDVFLTSKSHLLDVFLTESQKFVSDVGGLRANDPPLKRKSRCTRRYAFNQNFPSGGRANDVFLAKFRLFRLPEAKFHLLDVFFAKFRLFHLPEGKISRSEVKFRVPESNFVFRSQISCSGGQISLFGPVF